MLKKAIIGMAVLGAIGLYGSLKAQAESMVRATESGAEFTRLTFLERPDLDHQNFEGSWRDPSGMIWGNVLKKRSLLNPSEQIRNMTQQKAVEYCQSIGAQLPSAQDFDRLRSYMIVYSTWRHRDEFVAQILPDRHEISFWTSSEGVVFDGSTGSFFRPEGRRPTAAVRCVTR